MHQDVAEGEIGDGGIHRDDSAAFEEDVAVRHGKLRRMKGTERMMRTGTALIKVVLFNSSLLKVTDH